MTDQDLESESEPTLLFAWNTASLDDFVMTPEIEEGGRRLQRMLNWEPGWEKEWNVPLLIPTITIIRPLITFEDDVETPTD